MAVLTDPTTVPPVLDPTQENTPAGAAYCGVGWNPGPDMVDLTGAAVGTFVTTTVIK